MQKLLMVDNVSYPVSSVTKVTADSWSEFVKMSDYSPETFEVHISKKVMMRFNIGIASLKSGVNVDVDVADEDNTVSLLDYAPFMEWLSEQSLKNGKDPVARFKANVAKVTKLRQLMKDIEAQKVLTETTVEKMSEVLQTPVDEKDTFSLTPVESEQGVTLDVAIKQLEDGPTLPFDIVVQPELQTDTQEPLMVNEQLEEFNKPSMSSEDILTLRKKEAFINKYINMYMQHINESKGSFEKIKRAGNAGFSEELFCYMKTGFKKVEEML